MDRKTKGLTLLAVVLVASIAGGLFLMAQASDGSNYTSVQSDFSSQLGTITSIESQLTNSSGISMTNPPLLSGFEGTQMGPMGFGGLGRGGRRCGGFGQIEISEEYKTAVNAVLEADTDVQQLLANSYNVTRIMPIVKTTVDAEGNIATKATTATVLLTKEGTGVALVSVDLTQDKVTELVTYTKTVIKSSS